MKKSIQWLSGVAVAALLASSLSMAQTVPPPPPPGSTITVEKMTSPGYKVCYMPRTREVQSSRIVRRCGRFRCENFRVTQTVTVRVYADCHIERQGCPRGYRNFGTYPSRWDARDAVDRCQHTVVHGGGGAPAPVGDWQMNY